MLCITIENKNPYFCLAAESYLMHNFDEDIILFWQSDNTVVVGKHQIAQAEINIPYVKKNNITIARRISGGGTVFHDQGNINFSIIKSIENTAKIRFEDFNKIIAAPIKALGVQIENNQYNDLIIDGKKISGSAEHIYKKRIMHHGTLLFNADLKKLGNSLSKDDSNYRSKAVKSNRSTVTNIADFLQQEMSTHQFIDYLYQFYLQQDNVTSYKLSTTDIHKIEQLVEEKFSTWEWNFSYAPKYQFVNTLKKDSKSLLINLFVEKGIIQTSDLKGNLLSSSTIQKWNNELVGKKHSYSILEKIIQDKLLLEVFF